MRTHEQVVSKLLRYAQACSRELMVQCVIRPMPVRDSGPCRYAIPAHAGTRFRLMPVRDSGSCRYAIPVHAGT